jgi:Rad3-related DNA helicase
MVDESESRAGAWKTKKAKASIMSYFPYPTPRPFQTEVLLEIEKQWDKYDTFVLVAPTAFGKSAVLKTIAAWRANAAIIVPTNILVSQMAEAFPGLQKLQKRALYKCTRFGGGRMSCEEAYQKYGGKKLGCRRDCDYLKDNARARGRGYGVYNYYTYMANKLFKPTLLVDEAHNILKVLQDLGAQKIWRHDHHYPWDMWNSGDILNWLESVEEGLLSTEEMPSVLKGLKEEITSTAPRYVIKKGRDLWNRTTPPEERELLTMLPVDTSDAPPVLWPGGKVQKIVLLSATISYKDIESMGLGKRRTLYIEAQSPISPSNRPIIRDYVGNVNRANMREQTLLMCKKIEEEYLTRYEGKKGVIHATYAQAKIIREYFGTNARFIFHSKDDTKERFGDFCDAPVESGKILVASGMYEGIDLVEDLGRWQIIAKIPWLNLGDPAIRHRASKDESWLCWETLKAVMQACGRICRTETDFGETFIFDSSFTRLLTAGYEYDLIPTWWSDALQQ